MTHFIEVCEYNQVHAQCRCPDRNKRRTLVPCTTPDQHATIALGNDEMIGRLDPADRLTPQTPPSPERAVNLILIREHGKALAEYLEANVPDGAEKATALRRVEEAIFWAVAGLVRAPE